MPNIVPRFEDPAFTVDVPSPSVATWGTAPLASFENTDGQIFIYNTAGEFVFADPAQTLEQLITKRILTERLVYPGYDAQIGSDFWTLIGRNLSDLAIETLSEKFIREALADINLITSIDQVAARVVGDQLYVHFRVVSAVGQKTFDFARAIK